MFIKVTLRTIGSLFDRMIYSIAAGLYNIINKLASIKIFDWENSTGDSLITYVSNNIYVFLGIIMLFRLAIAFVQYIMDPDKLTDSKTGGYKLVTRCIVVLLLIVGTPIIFRQAMNFQTILLNEGVITKIIFGSNIDQDDLTGETAGQNIAYLIYKSAALEPNEVFLKEIKSTDDETIYEMTITPKCKNCDFFDDYKDGTISTVKSFINSELLTAYDVPTDETCPNCDPNKEYFIFDYNFLLSIGVGGFLVYVLLCLCVDVALRCITLGFYQVIAPIPIVSYLIPGKDSLIKTWAKKCLSLYLSLFINLATFMFGFLLIIYVGNNFMSKGYGFFAYVFLIVGILLFIKKLPSILKDIGLDTGGDGYGLSLGKRLKDASSVAAPLTGALAGKVAGGIASGIAASKSGASGWKVARKALGGAALGTLTGFKSGLGSDGKNVMQNAFKSTNQRTQNIKDNVNGFNRWKDKTIGNMGLDTDNSKRKAMIQAQTNKKLHDAGKSIFFNYEKAKLSGDTNAESEKVYMAEQWQKEAKEGSKEYVFAEKFKAQVRANDAMKAAQNKLTYAQQHGTPEQIADATKAFKAAESQANSLQSEIDILLKTGEYDNFADQIAAFNKYDSDTKLDRTGLPYTELGSKNEDGSFMLSKKDAETLDGKLDIKISETKTAKENKEKELEQANKIVSHKKSTPSQKREASEKIKELEKELEKLDKTLKTSEKQKEEVKKIIDTN